MYDAGIYNMIRLVLLLWGLDLFFSVKARAETPSVFFPASPECDEAFGKLSVNDPEWRRVSVRDPSKPLLDERYLDRLYISIKDVFAPWLKLPRSQRDSFLDMLKRQHYLLVGGPSGEEVYRGASRREPGIPTPYQVVPGKFVHEMSPNAGSFAFAFRWDAHFSQPLLSHFEELIQLYREAFDGPPPPEPIDRTIDSLSSISPVVELLEMPYVGRDVRIFNQIYLNYIRHHYPSREQALLILEKMEEIFWRIDDVLFKPVGPGASAELLSHLAAYTYLGAHAHAFNGANFSLIMGQFNYILRAWGLQGISHSNLDYFAITTHFPVFLARLRDDVVRANPNDPRIYEMLDMEIKPVAYQPTVLAHISMLADRVYWADEFIGDGHHHLEALAVTAVLESGVKLKYKAFLKGIGETPWASSGTFVGTRGQTRPMEQITFALDDPQNLYSIRCTPIVAGIGELQPVSQGEPCGVVGHSLLGLKIDIKKNQR